MEKLTKKKQADMEADMAKLKAQVGARDGAGAASRAADAAAERKRTIRGEVTKITPVQKALAAMTAVILSGAAVMHSIEDISFLDGCYWSVVTSTTVGYGDVTPKTVDGKIFASMYAFITIGRHGVGHRTSRRRERAIPSRARRPAESLQAHPGVARGAGWGERIRRPIRFRQGYALIHG